MAVASPTSQVIALFKYIDRSKGRNWLPDAGSLSQELRKQFDKSMSSVPKNQSITIRLHPAISALFVSASIEMWHRSVHSFLMSCSLAKASPMWSSVAGYYSSHYVVRAFSHLFGYYAIWKKGSIQITLDRVYNCEMLNKAPVSEHQSYWRYLKKQSAFVDDPVFSDNRIDVRKQAENIEGHDLFHRSYANYTDHINHFSQFEPLNEDYLIERIKYIAESITETPLMPRRDNYPDLDAVQIIAYARIIKYRRFLDEIIETDNQYWRNNRKPAWCNKYINYQAEVTPISAELLQAVIS